MSKIEIIKGQRFNKLIVIKEGSRLRLPSGQINRTIICKCDCGNIKQIRLLHLIRGRIRSCGCLSKVRGGESTTYTYTIWNAIKTRCKNNYFEKHLYYDKGIFVCDEWKNDFFVFKKWAENNGIKKGLCIDRIDTNLGYYPENCRFVTQKINSNNRIDTFYVNYKGNKRPLKLLLSEINKERSYNAIRRRILRGWDCEDAIDKPILIKHRSEKYKACNSK